MNEARKPEELIAFEDLKKTDPNILALMYQETGDERGLPILIDYFAGGSWRRIIETSRRLDGIYSAEEIRDLIVPETIRECLKRHSPTGEANFKTYTFKAIKFNLQAFYKSKTAGIRDFRRARSLNKPVGENNDSEFGDFIPSKQALDEDGLAEKQIRERTHQAIDAITAIILKPRYREAHAEYMKTESKTAVGSKLGVTTERGRQIIEKVQIKIKAVLEQFNIEDSDELIEARLIVFQYLMPELAHLEHQGIEQLEELGIIFSNTTPYVKINSADVEKFNVAIFKLEDGSYISGYEILCDRHASSVRDLFIGETIDSEKMVLPPSQTHDIESKKDLNPRNLPTLLRTKENLDAFQGMFAAYVTEEGKWHVSIKVNEFTKKWIKLPNGERVSGVTILNLLGFKRSQEDIKKVAQIIFGEDTTLTQGKRDHCTIRILGRKRYIKELQSTKNQRKLRALGLKKEDGKYHSTIKMIDLRRTLLLVNGQTRSVEKVFKDLGIPFSHRYINIFLQIVFPNYKIIHWREESNGHLIQSPEVEEVIQQLRIDENKEALLLYTKRYPNGQRIILDPRKTKKGKPFIINGKKCGIKGICNALRIPVSKIALLPFYQRIFGEELVVGEIPAEEITRQMKFKKNSQELQKHCKRNKDEKFYCLINPDKIKGKPFKIDGYKVGIHFVLNKLSLTRSAQGFARLCEIIFGSDMITDVDPDKKETPLKLKELKNLSREEVIEELRSDENKKRLLSFAILRANGQYTIDFPVENCGSPFKIKGKYVGIIFLCKLLKIKRSRKNMRMLYKEIFGSNLILDGPLPQSEIIAQMKKEHNIAALIAMCNENEDGSVTPKNSEIILRGSTLKIDERSVGIQYILAKLGVPKRKEEIGKLFTTVLGDTHQIRLAA